MSGAEIDILLGAHYLATPEGPRNRALAQRRRRGRRASPTAVMMP